MFLRRVIYGLLALAASAVLLACVLPRPLGGPVVANYLILSALVNVDVALIVAIGYAATPPQRRGGEPSTDAGELDDD